MIAIYGFSYICAAFREKLIKAIWSIILFMLGFAIMRLFKMTSDGIPDLFYVSIFL